MAGRDDFTASEWGVLRQAAAGAALYVSLVEPGNRRESRREMRAVADAMTAARDHATSELVRALAAEAAVVTEPDPALEASALERPVLDVIRSAVALVEQKAPVDLEQYRDFVALLAVTAAESARSGGFLGRGGEKVTPAEQEALAKVHEALGQPG